MNVQWITTDEAELRRIMTLWEAAGHLTAHPFRPFIEPEHKPSGDPAVFTAWTVGDYQSIERGYFQGDQEPARTGILRVLFWLQPGRGGGLLYGPTGLYQELLTLVEASGSYLNFFAPTPLGESERTGKGGTWTVVGLEIPFVVA